MKKVIMITAAALVIVGIVLFAGAIAAADFDFSKFSSREYDMKTVDITDSFESVEINSISSDIKLVLSKDNKCKVEYFEDKSISCSVGVSEGKLIISSKDNRTWADMIGFFGKSTFITLFLPEKYYDSLKIENDTGDVTIPKGMMLGSVSVSQSTGDIKLEGVTASDLKLKTSTGDIKIERTQVSGEVSVNVSTGDIKINDLECSAFYSEGSTGDIRLSDMTAKETMRIKRSTGDVKLESADGEEIYIETSTGDVSGTLRTGKVFKVGSDTGDIAVPDSSQGGNCEIKTDTGDIIIQVG